jgi:anti-sigma regulatory factor (Ser/Thr protein kinase)
MDPESGRLRYANAGQDLPYRCHGGGASQLWAAGMPLGMMPGSSYEEHEASIAPGESLLFYSDGLVEAHNPGREMFDRPRLSALLARHGDGDSLIEVLLDELRRFTGEGWEQEDDVTLITLRRAAGPAAPEEAQAGLQLLREASIASVSGNERQAIEWMAEVARPLHLSDERLADLKTAVAEAVLNAMEYGNHLSPDKAVVLQVLSSDTSVVIRIRDQGDGQRQPIPEPEAPDLEAKLAGRETTRGWGLFLIKELVDELHILNEERSHTLELIMRR